MEEELFPCEEITIETHTLKITININHVSLPKVEIFRTNEGKTTITFWLPYGQFRFKEFSDDEMSTHDRPLQDWILGCVRMELEYRFDEKQVNRLMELIRETLEKLKALPDSPTTE